MSSDLRAPPNGNGAVCAPSLMVPDPYRRLRRLEAVCAALGLRSHLLEPVEGVAGNRAVVAGRDLICYSGYNYLGYSGDPRVSAAAREAIGRYGTSVSASRLVAGERPLHRELEAEIAALIGADDALVFVSGHATNVTTVGCLFGPGDLILYDALSHNSIQQGVRLSGARAFPFPHNNARALEALLARHCSDSRRVLIATEGVFSTDGDIAPIPELIRAKRRHDAFLLVDEAHSMGVLGANGRGIVEHFGLDADDVDLWMGTLSKTFASCGGYIAGRREVVESLRLAAPGFVYSCGMTPPDAASALAAAQLLWKEPHRVQRLRENARRFKRLADGAGLDTGIAGETAIVPVILGNSMFSFAAAHLLFERGVLVHSLAYPVVPERSSRLRFFLTCLHRDEEIDRTIELVAETVRDVERLFQSLPPELSNQMLNAEAETQARLAEID